jgi:hypothetical protein
MVLSQKDIPVLCDETCPSPSPDGNEGVNIKTEEVSDVKEEEEIPVSISFPGMKAECEVSCMSVCRP